MELRDKVVLVVGASSGIGRVLALRLARAGADVAVTARRADLLASLVEELQRHGGRYRAWAADGIDTETASRVTHECISHFGRLDVVVLNAGGAPALDMRRMTAAQVLGYMRSNYDVLVNYLFPALAHMRSRGRGMVVTTNSMAGFFGVPLQGPYGAAKAALRLLIDTCRIEFEPFGIRFVSVYPGFVATEATRDDGMPAPMEISEDQAAAQVMLAMRKGWGDHLFPWRMRWLIRVARVLPKPLLIRVLRRELPPIA